jgi:hypothetical protein
MFLSRSVLLVPSFSFRPSRSFLPFVLLSVFEYSSFASFVECFLPVPAFLSSSPPVWLLPPSLPPSLPSLLQTTAEWKDKVAMLEEGAADMSATLQKTKALLQAQNARFKENQKVGFQSDTATRPQKESY